MIFYGFVSKKDLDCYIIAYTWLMYSVKGNMLNVNRLLVFYKSAKNYIFFLSLLLLQSFFSLISNVYFTQRYNVF